MSNKSGTNMKLENDNSSEPRHDIGVKRCQIMKTNGHQKSEELAKNLFGADNAIMNDPKTIKKIEKLAKPLSGKTDILSISLLNDDFVFIK